MRRPRAWVAAVALLCAGCMAVPLPSHGHLGGHLEIDAEQRAGLVPGETTREDVLLAYGVPEYTVDGDRVFAYRWTTSHGYWVVFLYYVGSAGDIRKRSLLLLAFDEGGRIERSEFIETSPIWSSPSAQRCVPRADGDAHADGEPVDAGVPIGDLPDGELAEAWAARGRAR